MKKVLFAASECVPFIKTGGLADVVGSLPKYFNKDEFDVRVMIPKYTAIPEEKSDAVSDSFLSGTGVAQAVCRSVSDGVRRCDLLFSGQ